MAFFITYPKDFSAPTLHPLDRRIIRIGSADDNDIVLEDSDPHHAYVVYEKPHFVIHAGDKNSSFLVAGKKKRSHKLSEEDYIDIHGHLLRLSLEEKPPRTKQAPTELKNFSALHRFALKLMENPKLTPLLESMLDELILLTRATKAFIVLTLDGVTRVQTARNINSESIQDQNEAISDSIVEQVLESGEALIVKDALSDSVFKASQSVIRLQLSSVLCVPLRARGATLGVIYLGNDNAINHFSDDLLEVVMVFAAEAGLILDSALARRDLEIQVESLSQELQNQRFGELIGASQGMRDIYQKITRIAGTDISVLIDGETGTGKELVARAIHMQSNRSGGPFVAINCGAIPENLMESELFGHVKGAFTGATQTVPGKFQAASGGTLFLDELGDMPLPLQVAILRAIQERSVRKVGSTKDEQIDVRFLAATHRNLEKEVELGHFREDLFYRINVVNLTLSPLRERGQDIILIARYFLKQHAENLVGHPVSLSREAESALLHWTWPGNIRELQNRIKKAIVFSDNGMILPKDLGLAPESFEPVLPLAEARERWQASYIEEVLSRNDGNRSKTARDLEVDPRTIFRHLEKQRDA